MTAERDADQPLSARQTRTCSKALAREGVLGSLAARLAAVASRAHTRSFLWSWSTSGEGADVAYFGIAIGSSPSR
jgi:hypothetical protein